MIGPQLNQGVYGSRYSLLRENLFGIQYWDQTANGSRNRRDRTEYGGDDRGGPNPAKSKKSRLKAN